MPKINKRQCLECFQKSTLLSIAQSYELAVRKNASKEALIEAIMSKRSLKLEHVLESATKEELKDACTAAQFPTKGLKTVLKARLLGETQIVANKAHKELQEPTPQAHKELIVDKSPTAKPKAAKKPTKTAKKDATNVKGFEETLWDSANKLRGSVESSEYKHIVLSLIFLKFISEV